MLIKTTTEITFDPVKEYDKEQEMKAYSETATDWQRIENGTTGVTYRRVNNYTVPVEAVINIF